MSKQEFIDRLRTALTGRITPGQVIENVDFYEEYINTQIRKGRSEADVMEELGDPRLISKSIITANGGDDYIPNSDYRSAYGNADREEQYQNDGSVKSAKIRYMPKWVWVLLTILVIIMVIGLVVSLVASLAPIILPILVVMFFVKLFRDWLN